MGSLMEVNHDLGDEINMDDLATKPELTNLDGSYSSSASTPEPDGEAVPQDTSQRQKRKGGRKPIYATSEERKQRNRQAQAAFRERRTEYIKQLETTIKHNEDSLHTLQQSHRNAADECLMLRYKNSLLERILLEKGIDVQTELRVKGGSPTPSSAQLPDSTTNEASPTPHPPPSTKQATQRHPTGIAPKPDHIPTSQVTRENSYTMQSPQFQPTPSSHVSSPTTKKSPGFALQNGASPTGTDIRVQQQQQQQQQFRSHPYQRSQFPPQSGTFAQDASAMTPASMDGIESNAPQQQPVNPSESSINNSQVPSTYYLSPFQKQYDQLEQEYDTPTDLGGRSEPNDSTEYAQQPVPPGGQQTNVSSPNTEEANGNHPFLEQFNPMLDSDPFGLTASMHFHTPFSYAQSHNRQ